MQGEGTFQCSWAHALGRHTGWEVGEPGEGQLEWWGGAAGAAGRGEMTQIMESGLHPVSSKEQHVSTCQKDYLGFSWWVIWREAAGDVERRMGVRIWGGETGARSGKKN